MSVKFGGVYLGGAQAYDFEQAVGVSPVVKNWVVTASRAARIPVGVPLDLVISGSAKRKEITWRNLYCLEIGPGPTPHQRTLVVADCRWLWSRFHVASGFNVRRTTGDKFFANNTTQVENAVIQPELAYAKWSLYPPDNGGTLWSAPQVLQTVMAVMGQGYRVEGSLPDVEIQDLEVDDTGDRALERVLAFLPGADVYIDLDGAAVVFNTMPPPTVKTQVRGEAPYPFLTRKHAIHPGDVQTVSRRALRPKNVHVLFTPEVELRFDFNEGGTRARDEPLLVNVAPTPDVTLTLTDGRVVARGTFLPLESLFSAWGAFGYFNRQMSTEILRKNALKHGWASFEQEFGNNPLAPPDPVMQRRASAVVESWRRLYQIDETFIQRITGLRANRVAIINTQTGAYAPAEAYCDWTRRPSFKGYAGKLEANVNHGWAVQGYASLLADAKVAPARVAIEDASAGIFRVDPTLSPYGTVQAQVWGYPASVGSAPAGSVPSQDMAKANQQREDLYARWDCVELSSTFQLAVVMTATPASPNDIRKFHKVTISQGEAGESGAEGPDLYVRVFPGVMTARYGWSDDLGQQISDAIRGRAASLPPGALVNDTLVRSVALATAKRAYANWRDMPLGSAQIDLDPEIHPQGSLSSVRHVMQGGVVATVVSFEGPRKPADLWAFMDSGTRRAILRFLGDGANGGTA